MATNVLGEAFINIRASMSGFEKHVAQEMSNLGKLGESAGKDIGSSMSAEVEKASGKFDDSISKGLSGAGKSAEKAGKAAGSGYGKQFAKEAQSSLGGLGDKIMGGLGKTLKAGAIGVGVAAGGALAGALTKGMGRLQALDQAEAKLKGLGFTGDEIARSMEGVNKSVKGTAFGLDEAAGSAAKLTGVGVEVGEELDRSLKLTADIAAQAGTSMDDVSSIVAKVAGAGKLTGETLAQLDDRATGAAGALAEHLGVSIEEARKQVSEGAVDFETFQAAMEAHIGGAALSTGDTVKGAFDNMQSAAGRFGAKLLDPVFSSAPAVFGAVGGAFDTLGEKLEPVIEQFGEWLAPKVEEFAENLGPWLEETVENVATAFGDLAGWLQDNAVWLKPVVAGLGAMAGVIAGVAVAMSGWNKAQALYTAVTKVATGQTLLFNNALKTNVIIAVVAALAALVAGLVYFFRETETGQKIWSNFTSALADGWDWAVEKIGAGIEWVQEKWSAISAFATKTLWPALESAFTFIGDAWSALSDGVLWAWENVIKAAWDAVAAGATWLWENALLPVFGFITDGWQALGDGIQWVYDNVIKPAWDALAAALQWLWETVIMFYFGLITSAWQALGDGIRWVYDNVIKPAWDALGDALTWLYSNIIQPTLQWIGDRWNDMAGVLEAGWQWINNNVFTPLGNGLDTVQGWFQAAVDGIGKIWDGLREAAAKPVKFVVDTVWNNGILAAWNAIADFLPGIDTKDPVPLGELGRYASGGVLPGYTPGRDVHTFVSPTGGRIHLSGGEAIMRPEWTRAVGGPAAVERMNRAARTKTGADQIGVRAAHGFAQGGVLPDLGGFALGGTIDAMARIVQAKYPAINLTSHYRPGPPYHGTYQATDWATSGAFGNSAEQLALAHDINQTYPGSAQLIYDHPGWSGNIYEGSPAGAMDSGVYKTAQAGEHHHHVHWAMTTNPTMQFGGGVFEGGNNGGGLGAAVVNWIADRARGVWDRLVEPIRGMLPEVDNDFARIPGAALEELASKAWGFISGLFGAGGGANSGSVDTSNVPADLVGAVETVFARHGFTGAEWEAAKWIIQRESNWNPTAVNPSSGAYGLFQFNPMGGNTLGAYLPDRNPDPAVQADAGARYMKDRYGSPSAAKAFWEQNQWYADGGVINLDGLKPFDSGGIARGVGMMPKNTIEPERVLSPSMTRVFEQFMHVLPPSLRDTTRDLRFVAETLELAGRELSSAYAGDNFGSGALGDLIGDQDLAKGIVDAVFQVGQGQYWAAADTALAAALDSMSGGWLDGTDIVVQALEELSVAQDDAAASSDAVIKAQKELDEAKKAHADVLAGETESSVQNRRKIADAEKELAEAQTAHAEAEGDKQAAAAEKVADAEEKLRRVREDIAISNEKDAEKQAEDAEKSAESVAKAEQAVVDAREEANAAADEVVAAEARVRAARVEAANELVQTVGGALNAVLSGVASWADQMAGFAAQSAEVEDRLRSLRVESATSEINRLNALAAFTQAEKDLETARTGGAEVTRKIGDTSVAALGRALETFKTTGVLSVDVITEAVQSSTQETAGIQSDAAEEARQANLRLQLAAVEYMRASINALYVTELQSILTAQLAAQQQALYGVSQYQYSALSQLVQGIVSILTGVVKIAGAIAAAVAAFAAGGPAGLLAAIPAIGVAISGVSDLAKGAVQVKNNWEEGSEAFRQMDTEGKVIIVADAMGQMAPVLTGAGMTAMTGNAQHLIDGSNSSRENAQHIQSNTQAMMKMEWDRLNKTFEDQIGELDDTNQETNTKLDLLAQTLEAQQATVDPEILEKLNPDRILEFLESDSVKQDDGALVTLGPVRGGQFDELVQASKAVETKIATPSNVSVTLHGDAYSAQQVEGLLYELNDKIDGVNVKVNRMGQPDARQKVAATR